jgi:hypothetical protein
MHLLDVEQRRHVVLHAGNIDAPLLVPEAETLDFCAAGLPQVAQEWPRGFNRPAILRLGRIAIGRLDQVESLTDEFAVLSQRQLLIVGEADIGMGVVAHIDRLDLGHRVFPLLYRWRSLACGQSG